MASFPHTTPQRGRDRRRPIRHHAKLSTAPGWRVPIAQMPVDLISPRSDTPSISASPVPLPSSMETRSPKEREPAPSRHHFLPKRRGCGIPRQLPTTYNRYHHGRSRRFCACHYYLTCGRSERSVRSYPHHRP
ncbi:hypothetical protein BKA56DRAFT_578943 [Ilyonectria sp. MPI-CAGE-AT-0026]|nr:hypothetical protein BKA56DRAFT_578943 [Ilyonectria sp. MPI-CAGE-AT-0026]